MNRPFTYAPPRDPALDVLFHDEHILVLNKPSGLLTVAGNKPELADCLQARAAARYSGVRIVHRLDKDTSGVIVLGLTATAHANLSLQFEKRKTEKSYIARVWGGVTGDSGTIDKPLMTDWPNRPRQHVDYERGRPAITHWRVLEREANVTRLALVPETGRSHQLRVHLLDLGHPILGDNLYAPHPAFAAAKRLQLHALELTFDHPETSKRLCFRAECPF